MVTNAQLKKVFGRRARITDSSSLDLKLGKPLQAEGIILETPKPDRKNGRYCLAWIEKCKPVDGKYFECVSYLNLNARRIKRISSPMDYATVIIDMRWPNHGVYAGSESPLVRSLAKKLKR